MVEARHSLSTAVSHHFGGSALGLHCFYLPLATGNRLCHLAVSGFRSLPYFCIFRLLLLSTSYTCFWVKVPERENVAAVLCVPREPLRCASLWLQPTVSCRPECRWPASAPGPALGQLAMLTVRPHAVWSTVSYFILKGSVFMTSLVVHFYKHWPIAIPLTRVLSEKDIWSFLKRCIYIWRCDEHVANDPCILRFSWKEEKLCGNAQSDFYSYHFTIGLFWTEILVN